MIIKYAYSHCYKLPYISIFLSNVIVKNEELNYNKSVFLEICYYRGNNFGKSI